MANNKNRRGWVRKIVLWTFFLSLFFNSISQTLIQGMALLGSLLVLLVIIAIGIIFDIIGVAATAAELAPLNAKAAKKVPGSKQALYLARHSDQVGNFCNDVVGDICGIVSGSAAAALVFSLASQAQQNYYNILIMAVVASLTVGGKGWGKSLAIHYSTEILIYVGKVLMFLQSLWPWREGKGRSGGK
ncbi:MAG: hypothetical protein ACOX2G_03685 [Bacillota bacterium]